MNTIKTTFISCMVLSSANAFNTTPITTSSSNKELTTRTQFLKQAFTATGTTAVAFIIPQSSSASSSVSSDPFTLPSYSDAVSNKTIDLKLEDINKKILDDAAAKRDDPNVDKENNLRMIELKQEEAEEERRLARMKALAQKEREERIAREKAEAKANRWNTF